MHTKFTFFFVMLFWSIVAIPMISSQHLNILVMTKTNGWRHSSIPAGINSIKAIGTKEGWNMTFTEDSLMINDKQLATIDVLIFLNTTGNILGKKEKTSLQNYMANGGGFVGIHSATDTESNWEWYTNLIGGVFKSHPKPQEAIIQIHNNEFPATRHFGKTWKHFDEWYNFKEPVRKNCMILASLDENSYSGGEMNKNHPISWYQYYEGGRVFYSGVGHTDEAYKDDYFIKMMTYAINWAGKKLHTTPLTKEWTNLLDDDLTYFDTYTAMAHDKILDQDAASIQKYLNEVDSLCGLNKDPLHIFTTRKEKKETILQISNSFNSALTTKEEYENYHLKLSFKYGENTKGDISGGVNNCGILYHTTGKNGGYFNVWMRGNECVLNEGEVGNFKSHGGAYGMVKSKIAKDGTTTYASMGKVEKIGDFPRDTKAVVVAENKAKINTKDWNTLEIICVGAKSIHILNGKVVLITDGSFIQKGNSSVPNQKGKIQIKNAGGIMYYKDIKIKHIDTIPSEIANQL